MQKNSNDIIPYELNIMKLRNNIGYIEMALMSLLSYCFSTCGMLAIFLFAVCFLVVYAVVYIHFCTYCIQSLQ